ncbi:MAG: gluconate 2-dehydrogenase subunit 3 family protein [Roseitalea porphyridii]|jgi:gluconate 2-dehydrogenase gamma chain|uniref:gluconate 2-dehydrogenase subunit 3 family protein n=1 Tax=Roseitalea porphyridii TaxID=1852022 RepID=UPI0032EFF0BF
MVTQFSRRAILAHIGAAGVSAALPVRAIAQNAYAELEGRPWFFLTDDEARYLAAVTDIFIPEDEFPSASQAGVVDFIDLQLAGPYGRGAGLYMQGPFREGEPTQGYQAEHVPAALIRRGIAETDQADGGLKLVDRDAEGRRAFVGSLSQSEDVFQSAFYEELLKLANWGYFADPIYGGNKNYAGWEMVGFPGAHAYYTSFVDDHNRPFDMPPKGIAHVPGQGPAQFLRTNGREG